MDIGKNYIDWLPLGTGVDGLAYLATRAKDRQPVELRVIRSIAADGDLKAQLLRRRSLIELCMTKFIRRLNEIQVDASLPVVVVERPCVTGTGDQWLRAALEGSIPVDRLHVAQQIITTLKSAHRVGLYHGALDADAIILDRSGSIRVDFSAMNCFREPTTDQPAWGFASAIERGEDGDLLDLKRMLQSLLSDTRTDLTKLAPRSRAALRNLLRGEAFDDLSSPSLAQWEAVIGTARLAPRDDDPNGTMVTPAPDDLDRTGEIQVSPLHHSGVTNNLSHVDTLEPDATGEMSAEGTPNTVVVTGSAIRPLRSMLEPGAMVGRYRLEQKLGQGGMGVVFRGVDTADQSQVAIKILWSSGMESPQAVKRFHKEARLLAGVQNDYVTRLHEVGEDAGLHFIAMEYVDGTTLKHWLAESGPLDEKTALEIVGDIARGLLEAHAQGIVHRDIKPENILLQNPTDDSTGIRSRRIKLSDFGIARQVDQSASMEVTQAGSLLGTPRYMSPEQCRGSKEIGPQADVYALGITLYELLTGSPPFAADDALRLAAMHCFDAVPSIQKKVPTISDLTSQIISRALAKAPEDRYADAAQMLSGVQRVLRGEAADFEMHPRLPQHDPAKLWEKTFEWDLVSAQAQLWPYVSNTERLNRAIGLPPVTYRTENDPQLGLRKFGSFRISGVPVSWEEHPFEWVEGSRMGILREFDQGPFKWFMSVVELKPRSEGGTRLTHTMRIEARNLIGRVMTTIEADWRGGKNLDRVYRRIDDSLQQKLDQEHGKDAFESRQNLKKQHWERIEQRTERLVARGVDADVAGRLTEFIATAPPQVIAQIRPLAIADQLGMDGDVCLSACLCAAAEGLLVLRWEILCPTCRVSASAEGILSSIKEHTHCVACDFDFRSDLGDAIELVFRAHPEIREVDDAIYCIGGPEHSPHVVAQVRLEAGERVELEVRLSAGDYLIRGPRLMGRQRIRVRATPGPSSHEVAISELGSSDHTPVLRAGNQSVTLINDLDHLQIMRIERMIPRDDVVTAARASTLTLFRELFPEQVIGENRPMAADEMTLLATGVCDVDRLYERIGDRSAYELIAKQLDIIRVCVTAHRGTVAKTVGEGVLAVFAVCDDALAAALTLQAAIDEESGSHEIQLSIGVNRGKTLLLTMNQRLDYFGSAVRTVSALPDFANGDILLTESVFSDPQVQRALRERELAGTIETLNLPGRASQVVQRIVVPRC